MLTVPRAEPSSQAMSVGSPGWAAKEWSYNLLDAGHQELFSRLVVFWGGCTLQGLGHGRYTRRAWRCGVRLAINGVWPYTGRFGKRGGRHGADRGYGEGDETARSSARAAKVCQP